MSNLCTYCHKPQTDAASLCHVCTAELVRLLRGARALVDELRVNVMKLDRTAIQVGVRSQAFARPLPINLPAAEVLWDFGQKITTWERAVRLLPEISNRKIEFSSAQNGSAEFLVAWTPTIRKHEFAGQVLADMNKITRAALKIIDLPEATVFLGSCETPNFVECCHAAIYAKVGASSARCSACGAVHDVAERREWLLSSMEELTVTASTARKLALYLGISIPAATISDWKRKGWLHELQPDSGLYRLGDILAVKRRALGTLPAPRSEPPTGSIKISA